MLKIIELFTVYCVYHSDYIVVYILKIKKHAMCKDKIYWKHISISNNKKTAWKITKFNKKCGVNQSKIKCYKLYNSIHNIEYKMILLISTAVKVV